MFDRIRAIRRLKLVSAVCGLLAFVIPIVIVLSVMKTLKQYPFGDNTIITWDMKIQLVDMYSWFRNVLTGQAGFPYSNARSLGGNSIALFWEVCASPLMLISPLFPKDNPVPFITCLVVAKFGLLGLSAYIFIRCRFCLRHSFSIMISICYALMLFATSQAVNTMWIDGAIVLPIIMLGVYRLVWRNNPMLMYISLMASIYFCWYNGYMNCVFVMLYYIYESQNYIIEYPNCGKKCFVNLKSFCIAYTCAVLSSMLALIPTASQLLMGKGEMPPGLFDFGIRYNFQEIIRSILVGIYDKENLPQLFTGMLVTLFVSLYFVNSTIPKRERYTTAIFLSVLIISTWYAPFDRIWCGGRDGHSFYCRFVYVVSASFIFVAARNAKRLRGLSRGNYILIALVLAFISITQYAQSAFPSKSYFIISIFTSFAYPFMVYMIDNTNSATCTKVLVISLTSCIAFEMYMSCRSVFKPRIDMQAKYSRYDAYCSAGAKQFAELIQHDPIDDNPYRIAKTYNFLTTGDTRITTNESMVYGYSQVAQYDSTYADDTQNILSAFGYTPDYGWRTSYNQPILPADSLLGITYVASEDRPAGFEDVGLKAIQDRSRFYFNRYALPLAFRADQTCLSDELPYATNTGCAESDYNPFLNQEAVFSSLLGEECSFYNSLKADIVEQDEREVSWTVSVPAHTIVYGFIPGDYMQHLSLSINDAKESVYLDQWSHGIFQICDESNEETSIRIKLCSNNGTALPSIPSKSLGNILAYAMNIEAFNRVIQTLERNPMSITKYHDGEISGSIRSEEGGILFTTIPFDTGWNVKVDGKDVQALKAVGSFLAFPIDSGESTVEMVYHAPGTVIGCIISTCAAAVFFIFYMRMTVSKITDKQ